MSFGELSSVEPNSTMPFSKGTHSMVWSPENWPWRDSELWSVCDLVGGKIVDMEWEICEIVSLSAEPLEQELFAGKIECEMLSSLIGLPGGDLVGEAIDSIKKPERRNIM